MALRSGVFSSVLPSITRASPHGLFPESCLTGALPLAVGWIRICSKPIHRRNSSYPRIGHAECDVLCSERLEAAVAWQILGKRATSARTPWR